MTLTINPIFRGSLPAIFVFNSRFLQSHARVGRDVGLLLLWIRWMLLPVNSTQAALKMAKEFSVGFNHLVKLSEG